MRRRPMGKRGAPLGARGWPLSPLRVRRSHRRCFGRHRRTSTLELFTKGLVAAREKTADAGGCQDVVLPSSLNQRLKEGFGAGREIRERGQRQRSVERIN